MVETTSFLPNSLSSEMDCSEPCLQSYWYPFLEALGAKTRYQRKHPNKLEHIELNGAVIAVVSYWYENDRDDYPIIRLDIDRAFALAHRQQFTEQVFRKFAVEQIENAKGWLENGEKLPGKEVRHIVRWSK